MVRWWCLAHVAVLDEVWPALCCQSLKFGVQILEVFYTEVSLCHRNAVQLSQVPRFTLIIIWVWLIITQLLPPVMKAEQFLKPNNQQFMIQVIIQDLFILIFLIVFFSSVLFLMQLHTFCFWLWIISCDDFIQSSIIILGFLQYNSLGFIILPLVT